MWSFPGVCSKEYYQEPSQDEAVWAGMYIAIFTLRAYTRGKQLVCLLPVPILPVHAVCAIQRVGTIAKRSQMPKKRAYRILGLILLLDHTIDWGVSIHWTGLLDWTTGLTFALIKTSIIGKT